MKVNPLHQLADLKARIERSHKFVDPEVTKRIQTAKRAKEVTLKDKERKENSEVLEWIEVD